MTYCRSNQMYAVGFTAHPLTQRDEQKRKLEEYEHNGLYKVLKVYGNRTLKIQFQTSTLDWKDIHTTVLYWLKISLNNWSRLNKKKR